MGMMGVVWICATMMLLGAITSCSNNRRQSSSIASTQEDTLTIAHEEYNSVYYWRTVFQLDSTEQQFLQTHRVERMYVRMFDVVENTLLGDDNMRAERVVPNATITFKDTIPVQHVVPTVYITTDALRSMKGSQQPWAERIVTRVMNMCSYNGIKGVEELQIDCDWTESTQETFFGLCQAIKAELERRETTKEVALSSTIRLHQLRQEPPPVDRGVLMEYNTGSFLNPDAKNSILSYEDVKPYLSFLKDHPLHLDFAYPIYQWGLLYHNGEFAGIVHNADRASLQTKELQDGRLEMTQDAYIDGKKIAKGDIIRFENSDYETVMKVKDAIEEIATWSHSTILYHLSSENVKRYEEGAIHELYK